MRIGLGPYSFVFAAQKTRRRNMGRLLCKDMQDVQEDMDTDGLVLLCEVIAGSMRRAMEWVCDERSNAAIDIA